MIGLPVAYWASVAALVSAPSTKHHACHKYVDKPVGFNLRTGFKCSIGSGIHTQRFDALSSLEYFLKFFLGYGRYGPGVQRWFTFFAVYERCFCDKTR